MEHQSDLSTLLRDHELSDFEKQLSDLGVSHVSDIAYLHDDDLLSIGMNIVQIRKLQALASGDSVRKYNSGTHLGTLAEDSPGGSGVSADGAVFMLPLSRERSMQKRQTSSFWQNQRRNRPRRLVFIRHGESEANRDRTITTTVPDHALHLTELGRQQALDAGVRLKKIIGEESVRFVTSPYVRTKETTNGILQAWGDNKPQVREDVRIREQEYGNYDCPNMNVLHREKREFGPFYYRFPHGESPADCYDRASSFLESLYRTWEDNKQENYVFVSHGLMILVMLMRLFRMPISEFECLMSLSNCEFIVLERPETDAKYGVAYTWAQGQEKVFGGISRKPDAGSQDGSYIWDGNPRAPIRKSVSVLPASINKSQ